MPRTALITGATAGLGAEFARQLAAKRVDLVLVARDAARLERFAGELADRYGIGAEWLAADLSTRAGVESVEKRLADPARPVGILVNNAGFGLRGRFEENSIAEEQQHLDVLVTAPLRLSHAAIVAMLPRRSGVIINVASVAAYTPRGTYGAAKAWVLSFSRWANLHYASSGIRVSGVAPGFVRTEFHERMAVGTSNIPDFLWLKPEQVVREALQDTALGKAVSIPSVRYRIIVALTKVLPARLAAAGALRGR